MMKKLLIVSILFTGSVNADIFQALKDATSKAVEAQNRLKNQSEESTTSSDQSSPPQFNSLAEEAAYKKRQEEEKISGSKRNDHEIKNTIIPRIQRLRASEENFYKKYLVKQNDTQEIIDEKFKNRSQLYNVMQKDFAVLDAEREQLHNIIQNSDFSDAQFKVLKDYFKETAWYSELSSIFMYAQETYPDGYVLSCLNRRSGDNYQDEISVVDLRTKRENFQDVNTYEKYLKCSYLTFQNRVDERAKKSKEIQAQKDQQANLEKNKEERQKVQKVCQTWRAKANKGVYSLGIGDKISCGDSLVFVIQAVNANTFTVLLPYYNKYIYKEKSMCIPAASLSSAPSPYCYR